MDHQQRPERLAARRQVPVWVFVAGVWLVPALLAAARTYIQGSLGNRPPATWRVLLWESGDWLIYALLTPIVFVFARRFPLTRDRVARSGLLHVGAAILLCAAWAGAGSVFRSVVFADASWVTGPRLVGWFFTSLPFGIAAYAAVLGAAHAILYFMEARARETQAARLAAQATEARLEALRGQMHPHFLLNSLNAITVTVRDRDTVTATRMLEQLGEMLQRILRTDRPQEVPLADELEFVRRFLAIEAIRFSDRLRPVFAIEEGLDRAAVPDLLLQPLVENALRHGLSRLATATLLKIEARREADQLVLTVTDDGPGPSDASAEPWKGVGLMNTRERLVTLYGDGARLALTATPSGGAAAEVRLPYHELPADREDDDG